MTMKAVTIWQPWATLIVEGWKPYEFRTWPAPKSLVGQRIAIHAGKHDPADDVAELRYDLTMGRFGSIGKRENIEPALKELDKYRSFPLGAMLGTAILGEPVRCKTLFAGVDGIDPDEIDPRMWAWPLTDIERLEPFVPARGAQGFWEWAR